jgi:hypothetical protein
MVMEPGFVRSQVHDRSYNFENVRRDQYRRNRKDIIASAEENFRKPESDVDDIIDVASETETCALDGSMPADVNNTPAKPEPYKTRSGREVRIPLHPPKKISENPNQMSMILLMIVSRVKLKLVHLMVRCQQT